MTTNTLTITAFILDRVSDLEAPTFELLPYTCEPGCCAPAGWVGHHCLTCGTKEFGGHPESMRESAEEHAEKIHARSRILATCKAHRAIVERYQWLSENGDTGNLMEAIRALASVWADHEAYDGSWAV